MSLDAEVIVAGAGPAGAVAARTLAAAGVDVLLVDRSAFPRNKPCGGGISTRALTRLPWLAHAIEGIDRHWVSRLHLEGPDRAAFEVESPRPCVLLVRRVDLDHALVSDAVRHGARLDTDFEITQALSDVDGTTLQSRTGRHLRARTVIAADGVHSVIAKRLGLNVRWPRTHLAIDMMEETPTTTLRADRPDVLWVAYAYDGLDGYSYIFPKAHHVNVGIGCLLSHFDAAVDARPYDLQSAFVDSLVDRGVLHGRSDRDTFTPFLIPVGGPLSETWRGRVLLAGDAGGFVNGVTAEGIYYAMISGELAARAVATARSAATDDAGARYERAWRAEIGAELGDAAVLQRYLFSERDRIARMVRDASGAGRLTGDLLRYFRGELSYSALRRRILFRHPVTAMKLARLRLAAREQAGIMITRWRTSTIVASLLLALALALPAFGQTAGEITYVVTIPEPEHHWLQVDVTFRDVGEVPLRARMSRSSPGRYATHEFAKNIFAIDAWNGAGQALPLARAGADEWLVSGHDGTVRIVYRIFGDHADGTYMAVDTTHAHLNGPATFLWAEGLESRPIRITLTPPPGAAWTAGTQLFPTNDSHTFTAPGLQYFLDSPIEMADLVFSTFTIDQAGRSPASFRIAAHAEASQADVDALAVLVERLVREQTAVFGELPSFEPGHYTFLLDYVPWVDADAMEHRNSTMITYPGLSLATHEGRLAALDSISHELFHVWNVERIRPADLEPFDFTRSNVSCCLWLAEGFTQYYGPLLLHRAGLSNALPIGSAIAVMNGSGRVVRSAVQMSEQAPFADAGVANDAHDRSRSYLSYYTYGAAIALGLDLSLRERTNGQLTLDDYMRRLWQRYGAVPAAMPGVVARPYSMADLRRELGELVDDGGFADDFFDRYVEGREVMDYRRLLDQAGFVLRPAAATRGWIGNMTVQDDRRGLLVGPLVGFNTPAYAAGIDSGDVIVSIDGQPATRVSWDAITQHTPGNRIALVVERRDGRRDTTSVTVTADPAMQIVPVETTGTISAAQRAFRDDWLRTRTTTPATDASILR